MYVYNLTLINLNVFTIIRFIDKGVDYKYLIFVIVTYIEIKIVSITEYTYYYYIK